MTATMQRRRITWKRLFTRHFIWVPVLPLLVALVMGGFALHMLRTAELLEIHGLEATATVIDRDIRRTRDSEGRTNTEYRVTIRFQPGTGPEVIARHTVSRTRYDTLPPGSEIGVRYVGHEPSIHEIEQGSTAWTGWILTVASSLISVVGLGLATWIGRRKASLFRAARHGEVREARVTGRVVTNTQINGRSQYRLTWVDAAGAEGRSGLFEFDTLPPEGTVIVVYVDGRTGRGWWEEDL